MLHGRLRLAVTARHPHRHRHGDARHRFAPVRASVAALMLAAICGAATVAGAEPVTAHDIYVLDGHTIDREGQPIMLEGFDAPDIDHPQCGSERALATRAAARLRQIIGRASRLDLEMVPCACPEGTEGTPNCNKGARCGRLTADGKDVGPVLVSEDLARTVVCGPHACPRRVSWCP